LEGGMEWVRSEWASDGKRGDGVSEQRGQSEWDRETVSE